MAALSHSEAAPRTLPVRETRADSGLRGWLTTVDHKRIGILYVALGLVSLVEGGVMALLMRTQLSAPGNQFLVGNAYDEVLTMHGVIMLFFAATPIIWGLLNYLLPVMIGARDVAFPRLNMFTFWLTLGALILLNASWFLGGAPDVAWYAYAPLSTVRYSPGVGVDAYVISLLVVQAASSMTAINLLVTMLTMRAPGMSLMRMPPLCWFSMATVVLVITAGLPFMVSLVFLLLERWADAGFFTVARGGDPTLWLNLFWMFGHPEVYILALPAFGMISEILPTFSGKPFFGYGSMVAAMAMASVVSWSVWSHHFFVAGLGAYSNIFFSTMTELISIPMAMLLFNWIATVWDGSLRLTTPMIYSLGAMFMFLIGGLSGIVNGNSVGDRLINNTYWIIAHFHYVIIGAIVPGLLAGITYWWPKMTGRMLDDRWGKVASVVVFVGLNATFFPQFLLGLDGMPRRIYTYLPWQGWGALNLVSTVGAFILASGVGVFAINLVRSLAGPMDAPADPWNGHSLEWSVPSPTPVYNFARLPLVRAREPLWAEKVHGDGRMVPAPAELDPGREEDLVHMPSPSFMPLITGLGITIAGFGAILHTSTVVLVGVAVFAAGVLGWALEDAAGYHLVVEEERA
jgi:cytochrome c oxidase subunit 1